MNSNGSGNGKAHSQATIEPPASLLEIRHIEHLHSEGFTDAQILELQNQGVRSVSEAESEKLGFKVKTKDGVKSGAGLLLPFCDGFAQMRLNEPLQRENGQIAKYLTQVGAKSKALVPNGCQVITEGAKDAYAGMLHGGIPTGALAGVSHYRKALKEGAGYTVIFDADGWYNPSVFSNLFHAGKYFKGKIQLVPEIPGEPKAGLCEYFKAGHTASDYAALLNAAMTPDAFLLAWPEHFGKISAEKLSSAIRTAFRLGVEYLDDIGCEILLKGIQKATSLSAKLLALQLEKQRQIVKSKTHRAEGKAGKTGETHENHLENWRPPTQEAPKFSKAEQAIERRANQLLASGVLFELVKLLLEKSGAVGIGDHVQVALASTIGTLRLDRRRSMPILFTGSSGIGKSMILDSLESLLPSGSSLRVSGVSDAVLKRIGATWQGKIVAIDEFSTWATSDTVLSTLKELISRGEASFEIAVPGEAGWTVEHFEVSGPIGLAACATEASIATIFGDAEEEIRSRFNEIPLPEDADYIRRISRAAFSGLEPENLSEKYPRILEIVHKAIAIALSQEIPRCDPLLEDALFEYIKPDRPLFPRLLKRLKILLENTSVLLGKTIIDLETYAVVYPLVSKVFRRSLTSENDATLAQFTQMGKELKDAIAGGYLPFKVPKIQDALSCGKSQAYRLRDKWDSLGWIESSGYATYIISPKGIEALKGAGGDNPGLPEILPPVDKLAVTMTKLAESRGLPTVFPYLNPNTGKASGDFIPKFSQVFPRFSQASRKDESLINNRFEIDNRGEFSQIPKQEIEPCKKNISELRAPVSTADTLKKVFPEGSLTLGNLGKPEGKIDENLEAAILQADGALGKTLGKPGENLGKTEGNSQDLISASSSAIAPTEPQQPAIDNLTLEIGDTIADSSGRLAQIAKFATGGWLTTEEIHISRDELKSGRYTKVDPTPPKENQAQVSAMMLVGLGEDIDNYELLTEITQEWTEQFKREVWKLLPDELQQRYKALRNFNE